MAILDFNGNRSFVGRCIKETEANRYDDSDFFMLIWDDTTGKPVSKMFATTRAGCGAAYGSAVDADENTLAKYSLYCERKAQAAETSKRKTALNRASALRAFESKVPGYVKLRKAYCPRLSFLDPRVQDGRDMALEDYLSVLDLLSNKRIRSNFKLKLRAQVRAWLDDDTPRYDKPLSPRQLHCLPVKGFDSLAPEIEADYSSIAVFDADIIPAQEENTMDNEKTVQRLIDNDIFTDCNELVQFLSDGLNYNNASLVECEPQLFFKEDRSELPTGFTIEQQDTGAYIIVDEDGEEMAYDYDEATAIYEAWDNACEEPPTVEALQFWIVSDWLAQKLEDVGALVARDVLGFAIWGRSECGQCLTMDSDLKAVAKLLERA